MCACLEAIIWTELQNFSILGWRRRGKTKNEIAILFLGKYLKSFYRKLNKVRHIIMEKEQMPINLFVISKVFNVTKQRWLYSFIVCLLYKSKTFKIKEERVKTIYDVRFGSISFLILIIKMFYFPYRDKLWKMIIGFLRCNKR